MSLEPTCALTEIDSADEDTLPLSSCSWSEVVGGGAPFEPASSRSNKDDEMDEDDESDKQGSRWGRGRCLGWQG